MGAVIIHAGSELHVLGLDAEDSAGAFDLEVAGDAEVFWSKVARGKDFLFDLERLAFWQGHAVPNQRAGRADFESVAARLFDGRVFNAKDRAVFVFFGEVAGE